MALGALPEGIFAFSGEWRWLSNFWPAEVRYDGVVYATVEHAYQAAKLDDCRDRAKIQKAPTPGAAKRLARRLKMRPDWDGMKLAVMETLLRQKFRPGGELAWRLLATGEIPIVEGNIWGDRFWGQCPIGVGENHLGRLLMEIREGLRGGE